jgi:hypothetical protein
MNQDQSRPLVRIEVPWDEAVVTEAVETAIRTRATKVRKSRMRLGPYNGFSGEERVSADRKIKAAIELRLIPEPSCCTVCSTLDGRIDYHAEDYDRPFRVAAICQRCHLKLHNRHRSPGYTASWRALVNQHGGKGAWFERLD